MKRYVKRILPGQTPENSLTLSKTSTDTASLRYTFRLTPHPSLRQRLTMACATLDPVHLTRLATLNNSTAQTRSITRVCARTQARESSGS